MFTLNSCLFTIFCSRCNETSSGKTTNFVNTNYPAYDSYESIDSDEGQVCSFLLEINDPSVCQVRVDFVDTHLHSPDEGKCDQQYMTVRGNIWPLGLSRFCGKNDGQHFYIELDQSQSG